MHEMYWRDVEMMIEELQSEDSSWTIRDENIAMLVDRIDFLVNLQYAEMTTDPNDPAVKARLERNKRNKVKPAPFPIYPPVAARPPEVLEFEQAKYAALVEYYSQPDTREPTSRQRGGGALSGWLAQMDATQAEFAEQMRSKS